ncbi:ATP-binding protein [Anabaena sp. UHCC 0451]|uniref:ATP-binding protein n=1 Tax=Anabaena sp. UHCC 0451 TaxID=2055235 RepID=UPI002B1F8355|nr:ATP-binding protein [Anabaena sp. UHCC 0451]MEA5574975.1 ATP-binding protein [Anabaena sp. UHCC 0451]
METLTVSGTLDSLGAIAKYVITAAQSAGLDKKATYKLRLAVDEIATNIILHGYEEAGLEGKLDISSNLKESALTICIEDTGARYDPYEMVTVEAEELNKPLAERSMGGLGVYLAMEGVDKYFYERIEDRNRNIFVVNCK